MVKCFILCSGLGHVNRGYESFTQECFDALSVEPEIDITLFKGGGSIGEKQVRLWNLPRNSRLGAWLGRKTHKNGYWVEQVTFTVSLLPHVMRRKPDVIYFSDCNIGNLLWHWRRLTRQSYKLLLSNGGPLMPPFPRWDHVQQVAPVHLEAALAAGQRPDKQSLVPYGVHMEQEPITLSSAERSELRAELLLPLDRPIILSIGTINKSHKRMDYVIREMAALNAPRPYLILLGQQDDETPEIRHLADNLLGSENFQIRTVPHQEVAGYYQASDVFVLASLGEGFGRVFLEAMAYDLPSLAHDCALTRYVLGTSGILADFEQIGSLSRLICQVLEQDLDLPSPTQRQETAFERFSWQHLRPQYVNMLQSCAGLSGK